MLDSTFIDDRISSNKNLQDRNALAEPEEESASAGGHVNHSERRSTAAASLVNNNNAHGENAMSHHRRLSGIEYIGTAGVLIDAIDNGVADNGRISLTNSRPNVSSNLDLPLFQETLINILNNGVSIDLSPASSSAAVVNGNDQPISNEQFRVEFIRSFFALQQRAYFERLLTLSSMNFLHSIAASSSSVISNGFSNNDNQQQRNVRSLSPVVVQNFSQQQLGELPNSAPMFFPACNSSLSATDDESESKTLHNSLTIPKIDISELACALPTPTPSTDVTSEYGGDPLKVYETDEYYQVYEEESRPATRSGQIDHFIVMDMTRPEKLTNSMANMYIQRSSVVEMARKRRGILEKVQKCCQKSKSESKRQFFVGAFKRKRKRGYKELTLFNEDSTAKAKINPTVDVLGEYANFSTMYRMQNDETDGLLKMNKKGRFSVDLRSQDVQITKRPKLGENQEFIVKVFKNQVLKEKTITGQIQRHTCHELKGVSHCLDCAESKSANFENVYCRFMDFRRLSSVNDVLHSVGFVSYENLIVKFQHDEFLPPQISSKFWTVPIACYVLCVVHESLNQILPWREAFNVRELCDVCSTTIFNLHMICVDCGFAVCIDCFYSRIEKQKRCEIPSKNQDNYGWYYCPTKKRRLHGWSNLHIAKLIPDCDSSILSTLTSLNDRLDVQMRKFALHGVSKKVLTFETVAEDGDKENNDTFASLSFAATKFLPNSASSLPPHYYLHDNAVLVLKESNCNNNLALFQNHWRLALPVIVENTTEFLNSDLWSPSVFKEKSIELAYTGSIVDCRTGAVIDGLDISQFWDGFTDCHKRVKGSDDKNLCLKLKDWPPAEKFSNVLPQHFQNFCESLPIPEYTHPRNGEFNLATNLSSICVEPDLGPKMYTAYETVFDPTKGTTNLHMDVSCAVNILVSVTTPANVNSEYLYAAILAHIGSQGLDEANLDRATKNPQKIGALWTIFRPEDSEAIRDFLMEIAEEDTDDPIHDQLIYLHAQLRNRLLKDRGVEGYTFAQMLGDAVFIPAGAAHQVQNLLCCIKVAEDFVSPEGVCRCAAVAGEFRNLTKQHNNHEDKLQLPNIVLHTVRETVRTLELNNP